MISYARFYESEAAAREVVEKLKADEFESAMILEPTTDEAGVRRAVQREYLSRELQPIVVKQLAQGRYVVAAQASIGFGQRVVKIMDAGGPVKVEQTNRYPRNPSPLSDFLGISALSPVRPQTVLLNHNWSLTGWLLSTPKSGRKSSLGMPLLSSPKSGRKSSMGIPLLSTPKSGRGKKLMRKPAPLSSLLGLPVLTRESKRKRK